jgi:hypothetical protein
MDTSSTSEVSMDDTYAVFALFCFLVGVVLIGLLLSWIGS